jgi:precorrin-6A/cobalt-precorrin-6A reductase
VAVILMHCGPGDHHPLRRLWLFCGTGDGPPLVRALLEQGWQLRVSVVTAEAACAYPGHPRLELQVGALGGSEPLRRALAESEQRGQGFQAVVDATHPFASTIHQQLQLGCGQAGVPLLRLVRDRPDGPAPPAGLRLLDGVQDLAALPLAGSRLLLAIGARALSSAVAATPGALHHARLLPRPGALQQALAAGIAPERVACLQPLSLDPGDGPGLEGCVEAALVRRWRIERIVARQSGPPTETLWRRVAALQGCQLLLLRQPPAAAHLRCGTRAQLVALLATWTCESMG